MGEVFQSTRQRLVRVVFTEPDDPSRRNRDRRRAARQFRVHLTSRMSRLLFSKKIVDPPELEGLRELVVNGLQALTGTALTTSHLDHDASSR